MRCSYPKMAENHLDYNKAAANFWSKAHTFVVQRCGASTDSNSPQNTPHYNVQRDTVIKTFLEKGSATGMLKVSTYTRTEVSYNSAEFPNVQHLLPKYYFAHFGYALLNNSKTDWFNDAISFN